MRSGRFYKETLINRFIQLKISNCGDCTMDGTTFIGEIKNGSYKDPRDNVFSTICAEYEEVVMYSLVTSFGLDFLVHELWMR